MRPRPGAHVTRVGLTLKEREAIHRDARMLELMSYGLTGLAAAVAIAFCFAYRDELSRAWEKSSFDLIDSTPSSDPSTRFGGSVGKQQERVPASLLRTTALAEAGPGAICSESFQNDPGRVQAVHG